MMNLAEIECSAGLFDSRYATLGRRTVLTMTVNAYEIAFFEGDEEDVGKFVNVTVERADAFALYGKKQ